MKRNNHSLEGEIEKEKETNATSWSEGMIAMLITLASPGTALGSGATGTNIPRPVCAVKSRQMTSGPEIGVSGVI